MPNTHLQQSVFPLTSVCPQNIPTISCNAGCTIFNLTYSQNVYVSTANANISSAQVCQDIFTTSTIALFGGQYSCAVLGNVIEIITGSGAQIQANDILVVLDNSLYIGDCPFPEFGFSTPLYSGYTFSPAIHGYTVPTTLSLIPVISLVGPNILYVCQPLVLTVQFISGFGNSDQKIITFGILSATAFGSVNQTVINASLPILANKLNGLTNGNTLTIPPNFLTPGVMYNFSATTSNFLGYTANANIAVTASDTAYLVTNVYGIPTIVYPSMQFTIYFLSFLKTCNITTNLDKSLLNYTVTQQAPVYQSLLAPINYYFSLSNSITFKPFILLPNTTATFLVTTTYFGYTTTNSIIINIGYLKPRAIISGVDKLIGAGQSLTLIGSDSYDCKFYN